MPSFWLSFRDCGSTSYIIVLLTVVALMDAVAAAVVVFGSKSRQLGIILSAMTLCLGVGIIGVGEYGQISGRNVTEQALSANVLDPSQIKTIREEGYREAAQCVSIGIGGSVLPLIFGLALLTAALLKKQEQPSG
jgi:hypothetical protein